MGADPSSASLEERLFPKPHVKTMSRLAVPGIGFQTARYALV